MQQVHLYLLAAIALCCCIAPVQAQVVHMTPDAEGTLTKVHQGLQKVRSAIYGNCHLIVIETQVTTESGKGNESQRSESEKRRYEYWSRENKYFRVDTLSGKPGEETVVLERTIITPERFVDFQRSKSNILVVTRWGATSNDILEQLSRFRFVQGSTRRFPPYIEAWYADYKHLPNLQRDMKSDLRQEISVSSEANGLVRVTNVAVSGTGKSVTKSTTNIVCDNGHDGVINSFQTKAFFPDSSSSHSSVKYEYSEDTTQYIPKRVIDDWTFTNGKRALVTTEVSLAELGPAPLAVFSIEGFGVEHDAQSVSWTRRGIMLGIGTAMVLLYFLLRPRKASGGG